MLLNVNPALLLLAPALLPLPWRSSDRILHVAMPTLWRSKCATACCAVGRSAVTRQLPCRAPGTPVSSEQSQQKSAD